MQSPFASRSKSPSQTPRQSTTRRSSSLLDLTHAFSYVYEFRAETIGHKCLRFRVIQSNRGGARRTALTTIPPDSSLPLQPHSCIVPCLRIVKSSASRSYGAALENRQVVHQPLESPAGGSQESGFPLQNQ